MVGIGKKWRTIALGAMVLVGAGGLSACGTFNGLSGNSLAMVFVTKDTKYYSPKLSRTEVENLRDVALRCGAQIGQQISSPVEAMGAGAIQYGLGYGVGAAAATVFPGAVVGRYILYNLGVGGGGGMGYGLGSWSYAKVSAIGGCMEAMIRSRELHHPELGMHIFVETAFVRSRLPELLGAKTKR